MPQGAEDALRYSIANNYSTARVSSLGGSFSSLGGNSGSIVSNPASLAIYRTDELSFTLSSDNERIESTYKSQLSQTDRYKFFIQNLSYVKSIPIDNDWNRFNVSISMNRKRDLDRQINISAYNEASTMANYFLFDAQGLNIDNLNPFGTTLAYFTDIIDLDTTTNEYFSNILDVGQNQTLKLSESGFINEVDIAFSSAYKDFIFVGLNLSFSDVNFSQHSRYNEAGFNSETNSIESFTYNRYLDVIGEGANFKFGAIIKPTPSLRLGWAYHSKTLYSFEESYTTDMTTIFSNGNSYTDFYDWNWDGFQDINLFNYELKTPAKTISSLALIFAKQGLITIDYETINYGSAEFLPNLYANFSDDNADISDFYQKTNNKKIGIEWKFQNIILRSGYASFESPYKINENDGSREYISGGIGFQKGAYFIDLAMISSIEEEDYTLYEDNISQVANISNHGKTILVSCSYKF